MILKNQNNCLEACHDVCAVRVSGYMCPIKRSGKCHAFDFLVKSVIFANDNGYEFMRRIYVFSIDILIC